MYEDPGLIAGLGMMFWAILIGAYLFFAYTIYKIAQKCKCDEEAWWAFIPILNLFLLLKMAEKPYWWFILYLIPIVSLYPLFMVWINVAKNAGHSPVWGVLAAIPGLNLIALPVMAFSGDAPSRGQFPPKEQEQHTPRTPTHVG